jgi:hypothetical protein
VSDVTTRARQWRGPPFWGDVQAPHVKPEIAHSLKAAIPMDPNGWRFSHPYYNDFSDPSLTSEVRMERVQARWQALDKVLAEQTQYAIACSRQGWIPRETVDVGDESVQSERDDIDEIEGEQDDHLDRFKSRTRYQEEVDEGMARAAAEELERVSAKGNRVVRGKKKQPKRHDSGSQVAEEAFLRSGNLRLVNVFDQAPVEVDEDDVANVSRLSFDDPTFSTEEEEPVAETTAPRLDNRWRPTPCVIAGKWTDLPGKQKRAKQPRKNTQFLTPAEERALFETMKSGRESHEYNLTWTKVIDRYRPLIWSRVRYHCKSWPFIIPEDVYAYTVSKIFEHKKIDKFNPNRGKLATLLRAIVKSCFIDYTRTVVVPAGLVGKGIKDEEIRAQSFNAVGDSGVEFGESLDASNYGSGLFPDWEAPPLPNDLHTQQEYRVFAGFYFGGESVAALAKEMCVSSQRVYTLKLRAISKIEDYYRTLDSSECA